VARFAIKEGSRFLRHVVPAAVRPIHSLWHEIIGFLFIVLAFVIGMGGFRVVRNFHGDLDEMLKIAMAALFVLVLGWYGFSSFRRARKISRS
jgi:hypothetical protein